MPLEQGWDQAPRLAQTRVWWWRLNGNTDKEAITRDFEAMKANGIGGANMIDAGGDNQQGNRRVAHGPNFGSPAWRELFRHAMHKSDRLGLEMGFNIQSGWNLGGPAVLIKESSKKVTFSKIEIDGSRKVDVKLAPPETESGFYRDDAVLAVPLTAGEVPAAKVKQAGAGAVRMRRKRWMAIRAPFGAVARVKPNAAPPRTAPNGLRFTCRNGEVENREERLVLRAVLVVRHL